MDIRDSVGGDNRGRRIGDGRGHWDEYDQRQFRRRKRVYDVDRDSGDLTVGFAGVTVIDCKVAAVTVNVVDPLTPPELALIVLVPMPAPVANPPAAIVATDTVADVHVTEPVRFWVLLSLNVPVAVNCCVKPFVSEGFAGVTAIDFKVATCETTGAGMAIPPVAEGSPGNVWMVGLTELKSICKRAIPPVVGSGFRF